MVLLAVSSDDRSLREEMVPDMSPIPEVAPPVEKQKLFYPPPMFIGWLRDIAEREANHVKEPP